VSAGSSFLTLSEPASPVRPVSNQSSQRGREDAKLQRGSPGLLAVPGEHPAPSRRGSGHSQQSREDLRLKKTASGPVISIPNDDNASLRPVSNQSMRSGFAVRRDDPARMASPHSERIMRRSKSDSSLGASSAPSPRHAQLLPTVSAESWRQRRTSRKSADSFWMSSKRPRLKPDDLDFRELTGGMHVKERLRRIRGAENRGIMVKQLQALLEFISQHTNKGSGLIRGWHYHGTQLYEHTINLYEINHWVIDPLTRAAGCSYVEAVAFSEKAQVPSWFVSHHWGEPVMDCVKSMAKHVKVRKEMCGATTAYWVCAYAQCQSEMGLDPSGNFRDCAFCRALRGCRGVLLMAGAQGAIFRRIWCIFEEVVIAFEAEGGNGTHRLPMDIAAMASGEAQLLTDGLTQHEAHMEEMRDDNPSQLSGWGAKTQREAPFPIDVMHGALSMKITEAEANRVFDKKRILNILAGKEPHHMEDAPDLGHPKYAEIDLRIRALFANAMMRQAVQRGKDISDTGNFPLQRALREDPSSQEFNLNFGGCFQIKNRDLELISESIPRSAKKVTFNFKRCWQLTSLDSIANELSKLNNMTELELDCTDCTGLTSSDGLLKLGEHLAKSKTLHKLKLNFKGCSQLQTKEALSALGEHLGGRVNMCLIAPDGDDMACAPPPMPKRQSEDRNLKKKSKFTFSGW